MLDAFPADGADPLTHLGVIALLSIVNDEGYDAVDAPVVFKNAIVNDCPIDIKELRVVPEFPRTFKVNALVDPVV
jgi:hypothetical protein